MKCSFSYTTAAECVAWLAAHFRIEPVTTELEGKTHKGLSLVFGLGRHEFLFTFWRS